MMYGDDYSEEFQSPRVCHCANCRSEGAVRGRARSPTGRLHLPHEKGRRSAVHGVRCVARSPLVGVMRPGPGWGCGTGLHHSTHGVLIPDESRTEMGATDFTSQAKGETVQKAFDAAVQSATYSYGHAGYTGTIAEKSTFEVIATPQPLSAQEAEALASTLLDADDDRIRDKWGPAGAIAVDDGSWLFFGFASS